MKAIRTESNHLSRGEANYIFTWSKKDGKDNRSLKSKSMNYTMLWCCPLCVGFKVLHLCTIDEVSGHSIIF